MAESALPSSPWPRRVGLASFVVLLLFGLVLLFTPELARDLEDRTSAGPAGSEDIVTVTTSEQTTEGETRSDARSRRESSSRSTAARGDSDRPGRKKDTPAGQGKDDTRSRAESRRRENSTTTQTSTTTTTERTPSEGDDGALAGTLLVPAVAVVSRLALVALLAALVGWALARVGPRGKHETTADPPPPARPAAAPPTPRPVLTPTGAEAACARAVEGIPLLQEVFAARGEPRIEETLLDMRARVRLTETLTKDQALPVSLFATDPSLGVASFRTELEQRLRRLARDAELQAAPSLDRILRTLNEEGLFEAPAVEGFSDLLRMTQRALRASTIDPAVTAWVTERGVPLLVGLDLMLPS